MKFRVQVVETIIHEFEVEAATKEEARPKGSPHSIKHSVSMTTTPVISTTDDCRVILVEPIT